jgi:hypothetical protein
MCVSQPGLWQSIVDTWIRDGRAAIRHESVGGPIISVGENDAPAMCTCQACRAWDAPDPRFRQSAYWSQGRIPDRSQRFLGAGYALAGNSAPWGGIILPDNAPSLTDRYARFYLSVYKRAANADPTTVLTGFAYANYWQAPRRTMLNPNIIISLVPPLWYPYTAAMSRGFREQWDGWRETGARLVLRPNLTHAGHNLPIFYARRLAEDFRYAATRGMVGSSFDSLFGSYATQGPNLYVLARMHQHPDWEADRLLQEYFSSFGPAASAVKRYFSHWENLSEQLTLAAVKKMNETSGGGGFRDYIGIIDRLFSPADMRTGHELLAAAMTQAQANPLIEQRVAFLQDGLRDAELTLAVARAKRRSGHRPSTKNHRAYREAMRRLVAHRTEIERENVCNIGYLTYREQKGADWDHDLGR